MLDFSCVQNYYIACGYTDMRKQIDGLAALVQTQFGQEMDETSLYLFCGRRADRIKALYWDGTGYILLYKRLTEKHFQWPRSERDLNKLTLQEFRWLMEGLSITQTKAFVPGKPGTVWVPSSIMRKFVYKSGRTKSAQGREPALDYPIAEGRERVKGGEAACEALDVSSVFCYQPATSSCISRCFMFMYFLPPHWVPAT